MCLEILTLFWDCWSSILSVQNLRNLNLSNITYSVILKTQVFFSFPLKISQIFSQNIYKSKRTRYPFIFQACFIKEKKQALFSVPIVWLIIDHFTYNFQVISFISAILGKTGTKVDIFRKFMDRMAREKQVSFI